MMESLSRPCLGFNEAGAIMPRSGGLPREDAAHHARASMRPGQSCPGVVLRIVQRLGCTPTASMRPGQSCPGVVNAHVSGMDARESFNEAGAIMPRSGLGFA